VSTDLVLSGDTLTIDDVVAVAHGHRRVTIAETALKRMTAARTIVDAAAASGKEIYGVTVGVGSRANQGLGDGALDGNAFAQLILRSHLVAQGPPAPAEVTRAAMTVLVNTLAKGDTMARPELADLFVSALNTGTIPTVRMLGSLGEADVAQMVDLALGVIGDFALAPGEGLVLLSSNAFSAGAAALAQAGAERLLHSATVAAALDYEAMQASVEPLHEAIARARAFPGLVATRSLMVRLLAGSSLWRHATVECERGEHFHDPLSYRCTIQVHGAAHDALAYARTQIETELNSAQTNPLVDTESGQILKSGNFEALPLALALDHVRAAMASLITNCAERAVKLLQPATTGLPDGLSAAGAGGDDGIAEFDRAIYAIAAEARLLAAPVSYEVTGTSMCQGIEDRMNMAPLAARRLGEMVELGERVLAIELMVAAQAVDLRGDIELGAGTGRAHALVRELIPFTAAGQPVPPELQPLCNLVRDGKLTL
jgi:histidine ammonia-lyase